MDGLVPVSLLRDKVSSLLLQIVTFRSNANDALAILETYVSTSAHW